MRIYDCCNEKELKHMAKVRQDAWSHEDDLLLAETVLRHVREGSTQLNAFEEVGDELNRTSAACGFRWNAEVRQGYIQAMELAKRQRKEKKRAFDTVQKQQKNHVPAVNRLPVYQSQHVESEEQASEAMPLASIIYQLQQYHQQEEHASQSTYKLQQVSRENKQLKDQVIDLEKQMKEKELQFITMKDDYETFVQIMERARKMTVFDDDTKKASPSFRMDKNGNLEQLVERLN